MSKEAYEMPDGLLTMDAADAADAWYREACALRSRVEALEGERDEALEALRWIPCLSEWASGPHCAKLAEGQGKRCPTCHARAALQPDKWERCGGRGWFPLPRQERTPTGRNSRDCPGCPDCKEDVR